MATRWPSRARRVGDARRMGRRHRRGVAGVAPGASISAMTSRERILAAVHNIQANVPPANIVALFDAALNYRPAA